MIERTEHRYPEESQLEMRLVAAIASDNNGVLVSIYKHNRSNELPFTVRGRVHIQSIQPESMGLHVSVTHDGANVKDIDIAWEFARALFDQLVLSAQMIANNTRNSTELGPRKPPKAGGMLS